MTVKIRYLVCATHQYTSILWVVYRHHILQILPLRSHLAVNDAEM